jgi:dihydroorotate dehydrogenase
MIEPLVISAPFGNWFRAKGATPTLGTYTLHKRAGFLNRWWRILSTVRYYPRIQSWKNKLGLPSPGIESLYQWGDYRLQACRKNTILSIHGFSREEWELLIQHAASLGFEQIELNLSCPNVSAIAIQEACQAASCALSRKEFKVVIAKLAPLRWLTWVDALFRAGVRTFHLCNTIPTPGGGLSGKVLMPYSLWAVEEAKQHYGSDVTIIGGGGITSGDDMHRYFEAGADHCAIGSTLLNPLNWCRLGAFVSDCRMWKDFADRHCKT